jgi:hypothetical protein
MTVTVCRTCFSSAGREGYIRVSVGIDHKESPEMNGRAKDWFTWLVIAAAVMASVLLVNPAQSHAMSKIELTAAIEENGMLRAQSLALAFSAITTA